MRLLTRVGRAVYRDLGDAEHARQYSLRNLSRGKAARDQKSAALVKPIPLPAQPAAGPGQPIPTAPQPGAAVNS
jgi:hypothetical protein